MITPKYMAFGHYVCVCVCLRMWCYRSCIIFLMCRDEGKGGEGGGGEDSSGSYAPWISCENYALWIMAYPFLYIIWNMNKMNAQWLRTDHHCLRQQNQARQNSWTDREPVHIPNMYILSDQLTHSINYQFRIKSWFQGKYVSARAMLTTKTIAPWASSESGVFPSMLFLQRVPLCVLDSNSIWLVFKWMFNLTKYDYYI